MKCWFSMRAWFWNISLVKKSRICYFTLFKLAKKYSLKMDIKISFKTIAGRSLLDLVPPNWKLQNQHLTMVLNDLLLLAIPFFCLPPCLRNVVKKLRADINLYDGPKTRSEKLKSAHSISFIKQSFALRNSQSVKSVHEKNFYLSTNHSTASQYSDQFGQT